MTRSTFTRFLLAFLVLVFGMSLLASPAMADDPPDQDAVNSASNITANFATQALTTALKWIDLNTQVKVAEKDSWFVAQFGLMFQVAVWILLPLVMISLIHAVIKGSLLEAIKATAIYLPVAIIGCVVAVELVQFLLNITDDFSAVFLNQLTVSLMSFSQDILKGFQPGVNDTPRLMTIIVGILMGFASFSLLFVMVLREASIYIATLFMPIMFACLVWPVTFRYFRGLVEFLIAMIFSKLIIVAVLSLAVAGMTTTQFGLNNPAPDAGSLVTNDTTAPTSDRLWVSHALSFSLMMILASFSPAMLKNAVSLVGASGQAGEVTASLGRPTLQPWFIGADRVKALRDRTRGVIRPKLG